MRFVQIGRDPRPLFVPDVEINVAGINSVGLSRRAADHGIKRETVRAIRDKTPRRIPGTNHGVWLRGVPDRPVNLQEALENITGRRSQREHAV